MLKKNLFLIVFGMALTIPAFGQMVVNDDIVTTEKATRAAYLTAAQAVIDSAYNLKSAEDAYKKASQTYLKSTEIHDRYILQKSKILQQK